LIAFSQRTSAFSFCERVTRGSQHAPSGRRTVRGMRSPSAAALAVFAAVVAYPASPPEAGAATHPLRVLVTNDDGVKAPGIDAIVAALVARKDTKVTVVAPAANQSGTGGKTTPGGVAKLKATRTRTAGGVKAWAVQGFPADSVRYALAKVVKKKDVDLVVSGINKGANLGPFVNLSGTVGAARAGAQAGLPALATSMGTTNNADFAAGVDRTLAWIDANERKLKRGTVQNLNIPECSAGAVRGTLERPSQATVPSGLNPFVTVDCAQTTAAPDTEIGAFLAGYATLTRIPRTPATA
jgi:5'-nucleotidase